MFARFVCRIHVEIALRILREREREREGGGGEEEEEEKKSDLSIPFHGARCSEFL